MYALSTIHRSSFIVAVNPKTTVMTRGPTPSLPQPAAVPTPQSPGQPQPDLTPTQQTALQPPAAPNTQSPHPTTTTRRPKSKILKYLQYLN